MNSRLRVDVSRQVVELFENDAVIWSAPVSTSRLGLGEVEGSHKTPRGRFVIAQKIGGGQPLGMRFLGRVPTGEVWTPGMPAGDGDWVTTRIFWLDGIDPENKNTKQRYIYFHGTNHEDKIGTAASHGCVRMRNADMLELYSKVDTGCPVEIVP